LVSISKPITHTKIFEREKKTLSNPPRKMEMSISILQRNAYQMKECFHFVRNFLRRFSEIGKLR